LVRAEKADAGASVTYQFGESEDAVRIYYSGMRVETFEALEKDSAELIGQKAITKTDWQRFKGLYKLLEWEKLTQAEKTNTPRFIRIWNHLVKFTPWRTTSPRCS